MFIEQVIANVRESEKSLRVSVQIPYDEAERLVVSRLIEIRNADVNRNEDMSHFDKVIRHFLTEDEFQRFVIKKEKVE